MMRVLCLFVSMGAVLVAAEAPRSFNTVIRLETTSEESANVSM